MKRAWAIVAAALSLAGCGRHDPPLRLGPPLALEISGCKTVTRGPTCELGPEATLRLYLDVEPDTKIEVRADDRVIEATATPEGNGRRVEVSGTRTIGATSLRITARLADGSSRRGELALAAPAVLPPLLDEAARLRKSGDNDGARKALGPVLASAPARHRAAAEGLVARADLAEGKTESALLAFDRAVRLRREAGDLSGLATDACSLARAYLYQARRPLEARATLEAIAGEVSPSGDAATDVDITAGLIAYETGDLHRSLERLDVARRRAERLGQRALLARVHQASAEPLQELGQPELAGARLEAAKTLVSGDPCERARLLTTIGWFDLQRGDPEAAARQLGEALGTYRASCPRPVNEQNVLVNLALAALGRGHTDAAHTFLADASRIGKLESRLAVWALEIDARIAMAREPQKAMELWSHIDRTAQAGLLADARWRAKIGAGETLALLGRHDAAITALRDAEAILDERTQAIPASAGRDGFLSGKDRAARLLVELLVERGRIPEAMDVARRSRARGLSSIMASSRLAALPEATRKRWEDALDAYWQDREALARETERDWEKSTEALARAREARKERIEALTRRIDDALRILGPNQAAAPEAIAEGELVLLSSPGERGWVIIAATRERALARVGRTIDPDAPPEVIASELLAPFAELIAQATRITVLASGPLRRVDVHALPFGDGPLFEHADVVYRLDVPRSTASVPRGGALVVADTLGDLPAARREGAQVTASLGAVAPISIVGPGLTHDRLRRELENAASFHFAGHGAFAPGALESAFPLADGTSFSVADVLALGHAPAHVVLTACESARTTSTASVEGLGLAHAFVVAGADTVLAATRPVADADAEVFVRALYASPSRAPAEAMRAAASTLRRERPTSDWASFRLLVR